MEFLSGSTVKTSEVRYWDDGVPIGLSSGNGLERSTVVEFLSFEAVAGRFILCSLQYFTLQ